MSKIRVRTKTFKSSAYSAMPRMTLKVTTLFPPPKRAERVTEMDSVGWGGGAVWMQPRAGGLAVPMVPNYEKIPIVTFAPRPSHVQSNPKIP